MMTRAFLADLGERAAAQYVESFLGFLIVAERLDKSTAGVAALAAIPAVLSLLKNALIELSGTGGPAENFYLDLLERVAIAYVLSVLGLLLAAPVLSISLVSTAAIAGIPAALAVLKGSLAAIIGRRGSAALLPSSLDPPA